MPAPTALLQAVEKPEEMEAVMTSASRMLYSKAF